jgi:hypothetical protein
MAISHPRESEGCKSQWQSSPPACGAADLVLAGLAAASLAALLSLQFHQVAMLAVLSLQLPAAQALVLQLLLCQYCQRTRGSWGVLRKVMRMGTCHLWTWVCYVGNLSAP